MLLGFSSGALGRRPATSAALSLTLSARDLQRCLCRGFAGAGVGEAERSAAEGRAGATERRAGEDRTEPGEAAAAGAHAGAQVRPCDLTCAL